MCRAGCVRHTAWHRGLSRAPALAGTMRGVSGRLCPCWLWAGRGLRSLLSPLSPLSPALQRQQGGSGAASRAGVPGCRAGEAPFGLWKWLFLSGSEWFCWGFVSVLTQERAAHVCAVRLLLRLWGAQLFPLSFPDNPDGQRILHFYHKILDKIMVFMTDLSIEKGRKRYDPSSL